MSTHFQLQVWAGDEYQNAGNSGQPTELRDYYRDNLNLDYTGYRVVDTLARDQSGKQLPMKPRPNWATSMRRRQDDGITAQQQAQAAADHYIKLRTRDLTTHLDPDIKTKVYVFPVKPSGRGQSAEFRMLLTSLLVGKRHVDEYYGSGWSPDKTRRSRESLLADHGYKFVEVDVEDYS